MAIKVKKKMADGDSALLTAKPTHRYKSAGTSHCQQIEESKGPRELSKTGGPKPAICQPPVKLGRCWDETPGPWDHCFACMWISRQGGLRRLLSTIPHPEALGWPAQTSRNRWTPEHLATLINLYNAFTIQACSRPTRSPRSADAAWAANWIGFLAFLQRKATRLAKHGCLAWMRTGMLRQQGDTTHSLRPSSCASLGCPCFAQSSLPAELGGATTGTTT